MNPMINPTEIFYVEAREVTKDGEWFLWPDSHFESQERAERAIRKHQEDIDDPRRYEYRIVRYVRDAQPVSHTPAGTRKKRKA
jgi:hypothetical protein